MLSWRIFARKQGDMVAHKNTIHENLEKLIKESCDFETQPCADFQKFHKAFLKFSFSALNVELDYGKKSILVYNSKPFTDNRLALYNEALLEKINYTDLEETLLGCVDEGAFESRFYRHLICEYSENPSLAETNTKAS